MLNNPLERPTDNPTCANPHDPQHHDQVATPGPASPDPTALARVAHINWTPPDPMNLPKLSQLSLPGPRRDWLGRGGATSTATTIRILVRCQALDYCARPFPVQRTGRPTPPARYWLFYGALARELGSFEATDQELLAHWDMVTTEFAAQGVTLGPAKHGTSNPVPGYHAYNRWRAKHLIDGPHMTPFLTHLTDAAFGLADRIRSAEGRVTDDPLNPSLGEILSGDASVFHPPSDIREETVYDEQTGNHVALHRGSRATTGAPRTHEAGGRYSKVKKHGPTDGFYHLVLSCKGYDNYTRVVLDVDVAVAGQAESDAAMPMLDRVLAAAPGYFQGIAYDGQIYPRHALKLLTRHGTPVINHNAIKAKDNADGQDGDAGETVRQHGQYKGRKVRTFFTPLPSQHHQRADGTLCTHHLISDDGALYPADRAGTSGTPRKVGPIIPPARLTRTHIDGAYSATLEYRIPCPHGDLTYRACITDTRPDSRGRVAWSSPLSAHRVIPEAWTERFRAVFGARNQSESFFSWLEQRYLHKDRVASWGRQAQLADLAMAAILANAEAWAHYAYRHGQ